MHIPWKFYISITYSIYFDDDSRYFKIHIHESKYRNIWQHADEAVWHSVITGTVGSVQHLQIPTHTTQHTTAIQVQFLIILVTNTKLFIIFIFISNKML